MMSALSERDADESIGQEAAARHNPRAARSVAMSVSRIAT